MKYLLSIIILSITFASYYAIGDTVTYSHQNEPFDICYGDYPYEQLQLSHFNGKISIFGLSTSWWPPTCTFSLEGLIDSLGNDNRIKIFESLDDPGQPYTCNQWGNLGQEGIPVIVETNNQLFQWFSTDGYVGVIAILDHNMVFRYCGDNTGQIYNTIEQILSESSWIMGDLNSDEIINIQDIVLLVSVVLSNEYNALADMNNDEIINVQDIILLINIILN